MSPDPARGGSQQDRKARTRQAILDAATALFGNQGVDETGIEEIAESAGVSVGTIYLHFGSKEAIAVLFVDAVTNVLEASLREARQDSSPLQRLLNAGDAYLRYVTQYPVIGRYAALRGMMPDLDGPHGELTIALVSRAQTLLLESAKDLKQAMDDGEIRKMPLDAAMVFVWGAWHGVTSLTVRRDALAVPPEVAERALALGREILLDAMRIPKDAPES